MPRGRLMDITPELDSLMASCNREGMSLTLNALCQSPVSEGMDPGQAIHNTVDLAKRLDACGYHRLWLAEHHSDQSLASSAPEVLMSHVATVTKRIRVGSGGFIALL